MGLLYLFKKCLEELKRKKKNTKSRDETFFYSQNNFSKGRNMFSYYLFQKKNEVAGNCYNCEAF